MIVGPGKLFKVDIKCRPKPEHPRYWEIQNCFVFTWLFDHTSEDAARRALLLLEQLPYERLPLGVRVSEIVGKSAIQPYAEGEDGARGSGFHWLMAHSETGTDEAKFLREDYWL